VDRRAVEQANGQHAKHKCLQKNTKRKVEVTA